MSTNTLVVLGIGILAFVALGLLFVLFMNAIGAGARKQKERLKQTAEGELADLFVFVDYNKKKK